MSEVFRGKVICAGVVSGPIFFYEKELRVRRVSVEDAQAEVKRFDEARVEAAGQVRLLYERALSEVGTDRAAIFEVQAMLLEDPEYAAMVGSIIRGQKLCAEYAVATTEDVYAELLSNGGDEYIAAREADIRDISERILHILSGQSEQPELDRPVILMADELTASDTLRFDRSKLLGLITRKGSFHSHAAILARILKLPYIAGVEVNRNMHGKLLLLDGGSGEAVLEADEAQIAKAKECFEAREGQKEAEPRAGIPVYANISDCSEIEDVLERGMEGVGLFRTEFQFLESSSWPSEESQFSVYKEAAQKLDGRRLVIRSLDLGADKLPSYARIQQEVNPALGLRGIRFCLKHRDVFKAQLRAILRASVYGNVALMFPMIATLGELREGKKVLEEAKEELRKEGFPFDEKLECGAMIETPAAALLADELAKEADFFSIGTNDLTQYVLAADRESAAMEEFYDPHHPAVLQLISRTVEAAKKKGIPVTVCGELAADAEMQQFFRDCSVDALSVSPGI